MPLDSTSDWGGLTPHGNFYPPQRQETQASLQLLAARKLISWRFRWIKHQSTNWRGYCAEGALFEGQEALSLRLDALAALNLAAKIRGFNSVAKFNDDPGTTHKMILLCFDDAIELARSTGA